MGDLTPNISRHEVACNCGCGFDTIDYQTAIIVQEACDFFSAQIGRKCYLDINSGCRCFAWNDHINGAENSQHLYGRALDHSIREVTTEELYLFYAGRFPLKYGIGRYKNFIHFDTRTGEARRW